MSAESETQMPADVRPDLEEKRVTTTVWAVTVERNPTTHPGLSKWSLDVLWIVHPATSVLTSEGVTCAHCYRLDIAGPCPGDLEHACAYGRWLADSRSEGVDVDFYEVEPTWNQEEVVNAIRTQLKENVMRGVISIVHIVPSKT